MKNCALADVVDEDANETSDEEHVDVIMKRRREEVEIETFTLRPEDFGLPSHPLSKVGGGRGPKENAKTLLAILRNEVSPDNPILQFVLQNVAALLVVSGLCEADESDNGQVITERGPGGGRWEGGCEES